GHELVGAISCCPLTMDFTMRSPYTFESLDVWKQAMRLKGDAYTRKLGDAAFRSALREEIGRPGHFRLFNGEWDKVHVVESARPLVARAWRAVARRSGAAAYGAPGEDLRHPWPRRAAARLPRRSPALRPEDGEPRAE